MMSNEHHPCCGVDDDTCGYSCTCGAGTRDNEPLTEARKAIARFRDNHGLWPYVEGTGLAEDAHVILAHIQAQAERIAELEELNTHLRMANDSRDAAIELVLDLRARHPSLDANL